MEECSAKRQWPFPCHRIHKARGLPDARRARLPPSALRVTYTDQQMCVIVTAKREDFRLVKVEDPLLGTTPVEKTESVENVRVQPDFPQFRPVRLVKVCGPTEDVVWHLNSPIFDRLFHGNVNFGKVHAVILTV